MAARVLVGDALSVLRSLPAESVQCVVTSPPYFGLRAYGTDPQVWGGEDHEHEWGTSIIRQTTAPAGTEKQASNAGACNVITRSSFCPCGAWRGELGSEPTPSLFIEHLVSIFDEVKRVLRPDGLCFVNLGDSYSGSGKGPSGHNGIGDQGERQGFSTVSRSSVLGSGPGTDGKARSTLRGGGGVAPGIPAKNLLLIPQRFAIAMQDRGWWVRSEIVWSKTSAMPESVRDRPTSAWEPIWMFSKQARYYFDGDAVRQPQISPDNRGNPQSRSGVSRPEYEAIRPGGPLTRERIPMRNREWNPLGAALRNVWTLGPSPFSESHFATFPPEVPRRCILAGTSEKGACPACGAPWTRQTGDVAVPADLSQRSTAHYNTAARYGANNGGNGGLDALAAKMRAGIGKGTTGWALSCSCPPADPVPCVVLDPFGGSGTTGLVADRLGRDAVLVELNPEYAEMARKRIEQDAGTLFGDPVSVEAPAQLDLFGEASG